MDNATRRQILERVKQLGYPNTIEALQNPQILDQYEQQLQAQSQQQQQPIQQPEPVNFPTPPVTTPNYKVPQPRQSEAKPLVMSFNETAPQLMKTGGAKQSCDPGYIWSEAQKKCIPSNSNISDEIDLALDAASFVPGYIGMGASLIGGVKNLTEGDFEGAALDGLNIVTGGAAKWLRAAEKTAKLANAGKVASKVASKATALEKITNPLVPKTLSLGRDISNYPNNTSNPSYGYEYGQQDFNSFAIPESTKQPVFVPKNTKKKFENGGKKCYTCNSSKMKVLYNKANYKK